MHYCNHYIMVNMSQYMAALGIILLMVIIELVTWNINFAPRYALKICNKLTPKIQNFYAFAYVIIRILRHFMYYNVLEYICCTFAGGYEGYPWCAYEVYDDGSMKNWAYCAIDCEVCHPDELI